MLCTYAHMTHARLILESGIHEGNPVSRIWGSDFRGAGARAQACYQTVSMLFFANDRCLRDYDLAVAHCC